MPEQYKIKSTITVDENDILTLSEKIKLNQEENKKFSDNLSLFLDSEQKNINSPITIGKTPYSLVIAGADKDKPLIINPDTIIKAMGSPDEVYHGHELTKDIIEQLPEQLRNPTLILKGSHDGSLVVITELKDKYEQNILIATELNSKSGRQEVNRITSAYGKRNISNYINAQLEQNNLIACNTEKANEMFQSLGLQLPPEETFISFDNSIAYSTENVKKKAEIFNEETLSTEPIFHKLLPFLNMKYNHHINQINDFKLKKSECFDKIDYRQNKVDKLTLKVQRLENINDKLRTLSNYSKLSEIINSFIKSNESKIEEINTVRIPKHQRKIDIQKQKNKILDHKIAVKQCKADRLVGLSNIIKCFTIIRREKRENLFIEGMEKLCDTNLRSLDFKLEKCNKRISNLQKKYDFAKTSAEKLDISQKINTLTNRKGNLSNKRFILNHKVSYKEQTPETIDKLIDRTEKQINTAIQSENLTVAELAENISISNSEYLQNNEKSIDSKETVFQKNNRKTYEKINPEFYESLKAENLYTRKVSDDVADTIIDRLQSQGIMFSAVRLANDITAVSVKKDKAAVFETAMQQGFQQHKNNMQQSKSEGLVYNSEFYKSLPKENRFIKEFTRNEALKYIDILNAANCKLSYIAKEENRIAVTTDNRDSKAMTIFEEYSNQIEATNSLKNDLSQLEFSEEQINDIANIYSDKPLNNDALFTFQSSIKPEYSNEQISQIYNKVFDIYSLSEIERMSDKNGLYAQLENLCKDFDYKVSLDQITQGFNFNNEQKNELFYALKSGISSDTLSEVIDEGYSANEIHQFIDVFNTGDIDQINNFIKDHKEKDYQYNRDLTKLIQNRKFNEEQKDELFYALISGISADTLSEIDENYSANTIHKYVDVYKSLHQPQKEVTISRHQIKAKAEEINREKSLIKEKVVEHSI